MNQKKITRRKALKHFTGISLFLTGGGLSLLFKPTPEVVNDTPEVLETTETPYEEQWHYMRMVEGIWP